MSAQAGSPPRLSGVAFGKVVEALVLAVLSWLVWSTHSVEINIAKLSTKMDAVQSSVDNFDARYVSREELERTTTAMQMLVNGRISELEVVVRVLEQKIDS